jgi:dipeptidyl aminopeptidase/acylaminoacyl peptidase
VPDSGERHLANVRQITFGGENAEAYFSRDGRSLTFQSTRDGRTCDQQYVVNVDGTGLTRVSTGEARPPAAGSSRATVGSSSRAPRTPRPAARRARTRRRATCGGSTRSTSTPSTATARSRRRLTNYGVYTAEGVLSPDGRRIVFTSLKDGDLDIYTMNVDGTDVRRLTTTPGYDGGPWWSPDGTKIVYRAWHYAPDDTAGLRQYRELLARG